MSPSAFRGSARYGRRVRFSRLSGTAADVPCGPGRLRGRNLFRSPPPPRALPPRRRPGHPSRLPRRAAVTALLGVGLLLTACGQLGPLYQPPTEQRQEPAESAAP